MCKYWRIFLLLVVIASPATAQNYPNAPHQTTSAISGGRFEIVQSPIAARWTFRLDRYTGRIWQLVSTASDDLTWEEMIVSQAPSAASSTKPRFQIFTSGIAARHTFLLDTDSGRTWQLTSQTIKTLNSTKEEEINVWQPFKP